MMTFTPIGNDPVRIGKGLFATDFGCAESEKKCFLYMFIFDKQSKLIVIRRHAERAATDHESGLFFSP